MERLKQAAQIGDLDELYACIQEDEEALSWIDKLEFVDTPLHIAARRGHVEFAMAMMYSKPSCRGKLNREMYSPMHIAVQNGHTDVVFGLLKVDKDIVRVKGKKGYTALHSAAEKGDTAVLAQFLNDCPTCIEDVTIENKTALHVAAQYDQLGALEILARFLQRTHVYCQDSRHILDSKDRNGNTVLHIAAAKSQPEMVKLLLDHNANTKEKNKGGFTASDLLGCTAPGRDKCLAHIRKAEGKMPSLNIIETVRREGSFIWYNSKSLLKEPSIEENFRLKVSFYERMVMRPTRKIRTMSADQINALLVVLALILTATYQALLSPPGGVWQADYSPNPVKSHVGESVMGVFSFMIFHELNFEVFLITSFFTVVFLQVLTASNMIALFAEILLSSLMWCILVARLVIEPTTAPKDFFKGQVLACLSFFGLLAGMEGFRYTTLFILNPPSIKFFTKVFIQK